MEATASLIAIALLLVLTLLLSWRSTRLEDQLHKAKDRARRMSALYDQECEQTERVELRRYHAQQRADQLERRVNELEQNARQLVNQHLGSSLQQQAFERLGIQPQVITPIGRLRQQPRIY